MSRLEKLLPAKIQQTNPTDRHQQIPEGLWIKCPSCETVLYKADLEKNQNGLEEHGLAARALELQGVDGDDFLADFIAAFGIQEMVQAGAGADAVMVAAAGADVLVFLQIGLVEHGLAARALDPQTLGDLLVAIRGVGLLDFGRQEFFKPGHGVSFSGAGHAAPGRMQGLHYATYASSALRTPRRKSMVRGTIFSWGWPSSISMMRLPMTTASATRDMACAVAASRMPKPTPTGMLTCSRMRGSMASTAAVSSAPEPVTPLSET